MKAHSDHPTNLSQRHQMTQRAIPSNDHAARLQLADETVALVQHWLDESTKVPADKAGKQLASVLKDPQGLAFTVGFIDGVIRPEDVRVAARNFAHLDRDLPALAPAIRHSTWVDSGVVSGTRSFNSLRTKSTTSPATRSKRKASRDGISSSHNEPSKALRSASVKQWPDILSCFPCPCRRSNSPGVPFDA